MRDTKTSVPRFRLAASISLLTAGFAASACLAEDELLFGEPDTLSRRFTKASGTSGAGGAYQCPLPGATADCPDWATQIFPLIDSPKYACTTLGACHDVGKSQPRIVAGDAAASYASLAAFKSAKAAAKGRPYFGKPEEAYILCNLVWDGQTAAKKNPLDTTEMPSGAAEGMGAYTTADIALIASWVKCGSPEKGGAATGTGGGGGAGGVGGGI
jgi:hypothetical protein